MFRNVVFLIVFTLFWLPPLCASAFASNPTDFNKTLQQLQRAVAIKDLQTLRQHVALETIVQSKIKKFSGQMQHNRGLALNVAGRAVSLGNIPLSQLAANYIIEEYKKSPAGPRSYYLKSFTIGKVEQAGERAWVGGMFMGEKAKLFAVWRNDCWVIVGAESAFLDREFEKLLKMLQNRIEQKKKDNIVIRELRKLKFW
jgi:hypothetical protein